MEAMTIFFQTYGWQLAVIALVGIVLLGVLKYANVFSKIDKDKRKPLYFGISVGFSAGAAAVYLLIVGQFEVNFYIAVTAAIYGLNQTFYAIYETTTLRDLLAKLLKAIAAKIKKNDGGDGVAKEGDDESV